LGKCRRRCHDEADNDEDPLQQSVHALLRDAVLTESA
jgi:hypothetical protein